MQNNYEKKIQEKVLNKIKRTYNSEKISLNTKFKELGFDSLDCLELLIETEKEFDNQITLKEEDFYYGIENYENMTINDLVDYVYSEFRHSYGKVITIL